MEKGELVYESKKGISFYGLFISTLMFIPIYLFFTWLLISFGFKIFFIIIYIIIMAFFGLGHFGCYRIFRGFYFQVYENAIIIKMGFLFRNRGQKDPSEIKVDDIQRIIYINDVLNIYWKDKETGNIIRSYTGIGLGRRWKRKEIIEIFNKDTTPTWKGPGIYNIEGRKKQRIPYKHIGIIFFLISIIPAIVFLSPFLIIGLTSNELSIFFILNFFLIFLFLSTFFGIIFLSSRTLDRRSYLDHGETFSIQAGIFMQYFTEYFYSDIETIERRKSIPFFSSINPFRYRYYDNPYSTKNCLDIYCIKFKEGYRIFEKGEYIAMKERHPSTWKKMRYLTISSKIFDSMHGRKIE